jgi:hypothetical protein
LRRPRRWPLGVDCGSRFWAFSPRGSARPSALEERDDRVPLIADWDDYGEGSLQVARWPMPQFGNQGWPVMKVLYSRLRCRWRTQYQPEHHDQIGELAHRSTYGTATGRPLTKFVWYLTAIRINKSNAFLQLDTLKANHCLLRLNADWIAESIQGNPYLAPVAERMRQRTSNPYHAGSNPAGGAVQRHCS